jgi:hypothetical protein
MLLRCEARGGRACVVLPSDYRSINNTSIRKRPRSGMSAGRPWKQCSAVLRDRADRCFGWFWLLPLVFEPCLDTLHAETRKKAGRYPARRIVRPVSGDLFLNAGGLAATFPVVLQILPSPTLSQTPPEPVSWSSRQPPPCDTVMGGFSLRDHRRPQASTWARACRVSPNDLRLARLAFPGHPAMSVPSGLSNLKSTASSLPEAWWRPATYCERRIVVTHISPDCAR